MDITGLALTTVVAAVFFYVLYIVVRAAVRDGIRAARGDRASASVDSAKQG